MNITQAGIGSGLDLESIIEAFVTAESVPTEIRLQEKEERTRTELSGVGSFKSALSEFQSVLKKLDTIEEFNEQTVSTNSDNISVSTNGFATDGSFDIIVDRLAAATRIQTENFAGGSTSTIGTGTLTLSSANGDTFDVAIDVAEQLKEKGKVSRGWLGVVIQEVNKELAESFGLRKAKGALVAQLLPGSPAEAGGLQSGDIITSFNGHEINLSSDLPHHVGRVKPGSAVALWPALTGMAAPTPRAAPAAATAPLAMMSTIVAPAAGISWRAALA